MGTLEAEPTKLKGELQELGAHLQKVESENVRLRRELDQVSSDNLFSVDDVYPRGFRGVKIGDRIDVIAQAYGAEAEITDKYDWVDVKLKKPRLFSAIAFYYDSNAKVKTVTTILFQFPGDSDSTNFNKLKQQLIDKYSETAMKEITRRGEKVLVWSVQNYTLELTNGSPTHLSVKGAAFFSSGSLHIALNK